MKKYITMLLCIISVVVSYYFSFTLIKSDGITSEYVVNPILNRKLQKKGYFFYEYEKNKKITIPYEITNNSNKSIKVTTTINDASNENNGHISYNRFQPQGILKSNMPSLTSMVCGNRIKKTLLEPHTSKKECFYIKTPNKKIYGDILGGISSTSNLENLSESSDVQNKIIYSTTILIHDSDKTASVQNIDLNDLRIENSTINLFFKNNQKLVFYNYNIKVNLTKLSGQLVADSESSYSLAPNSIGKYCFNLFNLNPGKYYVKATISNKKEHKTFKRLIVINDSRHLLEVKDSHINYGFIITLIFIFLFVAIIGAAFLYRRFTK